ncbi:methyl-accepting chemotaxis protein [Desulfofundulus sp. TPOSR]|uniref:methyl-accepting chemotaxis protein n=1 Tax=Desulfofundulus sp. TPOSR TaxID=2714340 RepID=UPI001409DABA|nr:methyl-accepting chemotaxis protein [Desulfofundulus sp. TPOSR]NHM28786.1 methyl-accepting chemotaxis protein [Desulfofundulus sp. TPOSR]
MFRLRLRGKLIASFLLFSLLPLIGLALLFFRFANADLIQASFQQNRVIAKGVVSEINRFLTDRAEMLQGLASTSDVQEMDPAKVTPLLVSLQKNISGAALLAVIDTRGYQIARSDGQKLLYLGDREYFKEGMARRDLTISEVVINKTTGKNSVIMIAPIFTQGILKGFVQMTLDLEFLEDLIKKNKAGVAGYSFIVDRQGRAVVHPQKEKEQGEAGLIDLKDELPVKEVLRGKSGHLIYQTKGVKYLSNFEPVPLAGWGVVVNLPLTEATALARDFLKQVGMAVAVTVAVAVLIGLSLSNTLTRPLKELGKSADLVSQGDLTVKIASTSRDEVGEVARAFREMVDSLAGAVKEVSNASISLVQAADQLKGNAEQISSGANETAAAISEVASTVNNVSSNAQVVAEISREAAEASGQGSMLSRRIGREIEAIHSAIREVADSIMNLDAKAGNIFHVADVIANIAEETNLLALNAAIEAARAGEHGRGFSVVAEEVRKLAEQSAASAKEINQLVEGIRSEIGQMVKNAKENINRIEGSTQVVSQAGESFEKISQRVEELNRYLQDVVASIQQVSASTENIAAVAEEQNAAMEEILGAANNLKKLADQLRAMVGRFVVS